MQTVKHVFTSSIIATALFSALVWADSKDANLDDFVVPDLAQESQHKVASKRITAWFSRSHYKKVKLNDDLSAKVYDRFLRNLDYNKSLFLKSDIEKFDKYKFQFDEGISLGQLGFAFDLYEESLTRRVERYRQAIKWLETPFDFTKKEVFYYDREDADWASKTEELDEYWRQKLKYDALNLKLAGKDEAGIKETLTKRYTNTIRRLTQTQNEDAFQLVMNSFARSIEAHTSYLSPRRADRFKVEMNLELEGIGAVLQPVDEFTVIRSLVPGGPADKTNQLKPEDKIIGVAQGEDDFVDIVGWRLDDVIELIKGKKGTEVRLQVVRGENISGNSKQVSIIRDKVRLEDRAADSQVFESKIGELNAKVGVVTIPSFYNNLSEDVKKQVKKLKDQNIEGLIIDLRGNGGGSLSEASLLTGLFIDKGPVVQIRNSVGNISQRGDYDGKTYYDGPLTVLVDRYSASASEIFAAALQDYGRALVVGEQTFGKGTVQEHRGIGRAFDSFDNKLGSIQFTVAKFYRIDGGSTQNKGVVPDILFPSAIDASEWGESQEENALPWDNIRPARYKPLATISSQIKRLDERHKARISKEPEFNYLNDDIVEYKEQKDQNFVSLNEAERIAERDEGKAKRLKRVNERLARLGLEPVSSLEDDLPEVLEELDPFLEETARIVADLIETGQFALVSK
ncbi:carboxy terminal-processing peptidase [Psychrosphaera ytuae]|uniref:Carboxy terminal-processing peptidase n=1 Tax=Psychrosphaera ytuae TaxID=2820710 RepID=A0A975DBZ0_9GAMM|nr:carboxy terminal-processing peptidase [Psychrosphaera ytuae]QTH64128.1 carboxy terminal-processing peptidase [Psychrosphaera ytuae]